MVATFSQGLPWSIEPGEQRRFRITLAALLVVFFIFSVVIPGIELPERQREELEALPPQLAKVVLEKKELPKPEIKKPEPEPEKPKPEEKKPEPKVEKKPELKVKPQPKPQTVEQAREVAKSSGLLAMQDQLSDLRALADTVQLDQPNLVTAKPISRKASGGLVSQVSTASSGGVDTSKLDQSAKQISLASRKTTEVAQPAGVAAAVAAAETARQGQKGGAERTREELRRVFDANKGAIYTIYNRELRNNPSLQGSITPELVVEASGAVSSCKVVESSLNEPVLEKKICARLMLVNFGSKSGAGKQTIRYPIELLPG
ncbi:MAG: AgmX/PglI C-terminal domain-containing protein [Hahellaceae bacterium]|nr:AgmX/PglI C-terminal domain-containing protein [Hahellaceae bacterium]